MFHIGDLVTGWKGNKYRDVFSNHAKLKIVGMDQSGCDLELLDIDLPEFQEKIGRVLRFANLKAFVENFELITKYIEVVW